MAKKEKSLFWASYADLMTSLFFVMLVLFIGAIVVLDQERREFKGKYETSKKEKEILEQINDATKNIDSTYFEYKEEFKKHKLKISVNYGNDVDQIETLPELTQKQLLAAGVKLRDFVQETTSQNPNIQYLLIIEGQASKIGPEAINYPLSYRRAYGLKQFWENNGIKFTATNCEVLICGSGDGRQSGTGLMREKTEKLNQRFLIHILPKPGQTNETKTSNSSHIVK
jgi:outer membrane protein OmpA-like peptidoglycan-associated protein